jgi:MFS family permease
VFASLFIGRKYMFITVFAALIALLATFYSPQFSNPNFVALIMVTAGTAVLITFSVISGLIFAPLQTLEQNVVPRLMHQFRKDKLWHLLSLAIFLFPFLSYLLAIAFFSFDFPYKHLLFAGWILALGAVLDLIRDSLNRTASLLNPFHGIEVLRHNAIRAIQDEQDAELWGSVDALAEVAVRAVENSQIALATQTLNMFPPILKTFFDSSKSISRVNQDSAVEKKTGSDEVSYTVFYILQRLELINSRALEVHLSFICSHIITVLGKIIVYCAQLDLSLVTFPAHILGKLALKALQYHYDEVAALGTSTLLEVSKTIINEVDLTYAELVEPFNTIIDSVDAIAQTTFKKDKTVDIKMVAQPLKELKTIFENEKIATHRDTPEILRHIDSKIAEFEALEQVMRSIPPIPTLE